VISGQVCNRVGGGGGGGGAASTESVTLHEPLVGGGGVRHGQDAALAGRGCLIVTDWVWCHGPRSEMEVTVVATVQWEHCIVWALYCWINSPPDQSIGTGDFSVCCQPS